MWHLLRTSVRLRALTSWCAPHLPVEYAILLLVHLAKHDEEYVKPVEVQIGLSASVPHSSKHWKRSKDNTTSLLHRPTSRFKRWKPSHNATHSFCRSTTAGFVPRFARSEISRVLLYDAEHDDIPHRWRCQCKPAAARENNYARASMPV